MGASFTNFQIRNTSTKAVCDALARLAAGNAYVSPAMNNWVTVYAEATEDQNDKTLQAIASGLSQSLKTEVFGFLVHDSDIALYWLYETGALVDEFNSAPDYFDNEVDDKTRARMRGNSETLLPLCIVSTTRADIEAIIHPADGMPLMSESKAIPTHGLGFEDAFAKDMFGKQAALEIRQQAKAEKVKIADFP